ncbi:hypothetical protein PGAG_00324 [Phaeocystis globosa virus 12T]|uniref:Uncharacterized protein n=1 Tax=Phaeocystis globosa virus PgV-16T TaxID=3071227 RepID=A0AC59EY23_9VIRU|nr:hypothetical protein PGCG_00363 [Phaeocystis globosa virus]AET73213.1 hypothetical protein PGAG_00324 [Phaeocystis globosa virus 12T]AET74037.1 hypothetical protein PGBG_00329 [Phaeocystis globosa virus 14T]AGM15674.1 hypothetical protein PGCG_00363 [Phaeocystis globosa virus PgV-16T]UYE94404.1 hypothetical protein PGV14T_00363 [Phaeocystis globosa virus]
MTTFVNTQNNMDGYKIYNMYGGYVDDEDEAEYLRLADEAEELYIASMKAVEEEKKLARQKKLLIMRINRHMRMMSALKQRKAAMKTLTIIME